MKKMTEQEEMDLYELGLDYASAYESEDSNVNPGGYSERQVGMFHGFVDGYLKAKKELYTVDDLLNSFKAGNAFLNNDDLDIRKIFEEFLKTMK